MQCAAPGGGAMLLCLLAVATLIGVHRVGVRDQSKTMPILMVYSLFFLLEAWLYINGPSKLDAPISSKQFFGLKFSFE